MTFISNGQAEVDPLVRILLIPAVFACLLFASLQAAAQAPDVQCWPHKAKRDEVPVFDEPETTSAVIGRLKLGEQVCGVGEQQGFAVIDWSRQDSVNNRPTMTKAEPELAFVRLVDLWPPAAEKTSAQHDFPGRVKEFFSYLRSGGMPEDVLGPFGSFFSRKPKCEAGKICEKLKEEQKHPSK